MNKQIKGILEAIAVVIVFLGFSYLIQSNLDFFQGLVTNNLTGMFIYFILEVASIVVAPVTTLPLVVVATNLWGWIATGILNFVGWFIGSWIAFVIARKYGVRIVRKFISIEKIHEIEQRIPRKHLFWSVVLLRTAIPADVLSYALGIFTKMKLKRYLLATAIGIAPFAFLLAYFGGIRIEYQILLFLIVGILIAIGWITKLTCKKCVEFVQKRSG